MSRKAKSRGPVPTAPGAPEEAGAEPGQSLATSGAASGVSETWEEQASTQAWEATLRTREAQLHPQRSSCSGTKYLSRTYYVPTLWTEQRNAHLASRPVEDADSEQAAIQ